MEYIANLCLVFVDFEEAQDSVKRSKMCHAIKSYGTAVYNLNFIRETKDGFNNSNSQWRSLGFWQPNEQSQWPPLKKNYKF